MTSHMQSLLTQPKDDVPVFVQANKLAPIVHVSNRSINLMNTGAAIIEKQIKRLPSPKSSAPYI